MSGVFTHPSRVKKTKSAFTDAGGSVVAVKTTADARSASHMSAVYPPYLAGFTDVLASRPMPRQRPEERVWLVREIVIPCLKLKALSMTDEVMRTCPEAIGVDLFEWIDESVEM